MHEMAITQSVLNIALNAAREAGAERVTKIRIRMGEYSDIVPQIMRDYFAVAARGTPAAGAEIEITRIPVTMRCNECGWQGSVDRSDIRCGACGSIFLRMISGREFYVESIEADEPGSAADPGTE